MIYKDSLKEINGGSPDTTNNIMELTAVIEGLNALKFPCEVDVYSDSSYVVNAFNNHWIEGWKKSNWINSKKEPVKNRELWEELIKLTTIHKVTFNKVKGHSDNEYNNRCDKLAKEGIDKNA